MSSRRTSLVLLTLTVLLLAPAAARAQDEASGEDAPRIVSAGQDAAGEHAFLAFTPSGPAVFVGKPGHLVKLHVKYVSPGEDSYTVGTEEHGRMIFNTVERKVILPGGIGFTAKLSHSLAHEADAAARAEVEARIAVKKAPSAEAPPPPISQGGGHVVRMVSTEHTAGSKLLGGSREKITRARLRLRSHVARRAPRTAIKAKLKGH